MKIYPILFVFLSTNLFGQADSVQQEKPWQFSGYIEPYYGFDKNRPADGYRPGFIYSHNRHNEVALNLAFAKASYARAGVRGNFALMTGTYAAANLSAEPGVFQHVLEANTGLKLSKKHDIWFDAGVFPAHIGFESAVGKDCWTLTRSLAAENSPYYEAGAKLTLQTRNGKWLFSVLALNGWQSITRRGRTMAGGTQIQWKPSEKVTLNSSTFYGTLNSVEWQPRFFHNFYAILQASEHFGVTAGFDWGREKSLTPWENLYNNWYTPVLIMRAGVSKYTTLVLRWEYFKDKGSSVIPAQNGNAFNANGLSAGLDFSLRKNVLWRVESRVISNETPFFIRNNGWKKSNSFLSSALAISF